MSGRREVDAWKVGGTKSRKKYKKVILHVKMPKLHVKMLKKSKITCKNGKKDENYM